MSPDSPQGSPEPETGRIPKGSMNVCSIYMDLPGAAAAIS